MPFTVSHAVVALAVRRTPLPIAAIAVGAMAPDAVLFAPFLPPYEFAHSWLGVVTIDLAVALVVLAVWWWLVRPAWSGAVPGLRERLPTDWRRPPRLAPRDVLLIVVGCIVGSITHVLWDAFSHEHAWAVQSIPFLRTEVDGYPVWAAVQDASSVLGLVGLLVAAGVWWRRSTPRPVSRSGAGERAVALVALVALVVVVASAAVLAGHAVLGGGGAGGIVVVFAFRLPIVVAAALVLGAVALLAVGRGRRAD